MRWQRDDAGRTRLEAKALCDSLATQARSDPIFGAGVQARDKAARTFESRRYVDNVLSLAEVETALVADADSLDRDTYC
jgi:hypothetical protein